jgi:hypothetical protein
MLLEQDSERLLVEKRNQVAIELNATEVAEQARNAYTEFSPPRGGFQIASDA